MDYKINSKDIDHPLLKPIIEELNPVFEKLEMKFFLIGAVARDILMELSGEKSGRRTMDLDLAIAINNWEEFRELSDAITALDNFSKDEKQKQRFLYKNTFQLDVVPYGKIKDQHDKIFWPPDHSFAMSVLGFDDVKDSLLQIQCDEDLTFEIISLNGIFLLKLFAWKDRFLRTNKDADDIGFILNNYFHIHRDVSFEEPYNIVYELDEFTEIAAGAIILGMQLNELLNTNDTTKTKVKSLLEEEIQIAEESKLINQIIETNRNLKFDEVKSALNLIKDQIKLNDHNSST